MRILCLWSLGSEETDRDLVCLRNNGAKIIPLKVVYSPLKAMKSKHGSVFLTVFITIPMLVLPNIILFKIEETILQYGLGQTA